MKRKIIAWTIWPLSMAFAASAFAGKPEELKWVDVPPNIQKTISQYRGDGQIEEIKKETRTIDGKSRIIYETKVRKSGPEGKILEIEVDDNGKLVELEDD